jgi:hypothetical protein
MIDTPLNKSGKKDAEKLKALLKRSISFWEKQGRTAMKYANDSKRKLAEMEKYGK